MFPEEVLSQLKERKTPFYYYDLDNLRSSLDQVKKYGIERGFKIHFALKANHQQRILEVINKYGLGADCVSGGEIQQAIDCGFDPSHIVFAGVGKSDEEIELALQHDIYCFNCESPQELQVLNELAGKHQKTASIALRLNPDVNADTHRYITTGLNENKFGINIGDLDTVLDMLPDLQNLELIGIHFHIGSQIEKLDPFERLCHRAKELASHIEERGYTLKIINVGGGYGIDYDHPSRQSVNDFQSFFQLFEDHLPLKKHQTLHFELGRSIVGQCGSLITRVLYTKNGIAKKFAIVDAGMTELIRPALYEAKHRIDVLTSNKDEVTYDVVGPVCESSDFFRKGVNIPAVERGDLIAIRSAGAYGEVMRSSYNLRTANPSIYSDDLKKIPKQ